MNETLTPHTHTHNLSRKNREHHKTIEQNKITAQLREQIATYDGTAAAAAVAN